MSAVTPFPIASSTGLIEAIADDLEAVGDGNHAPVLRRYLTPYVVRWLSAGVPREEVDAEVARLAEAAGVTVVAREASRIIEENQRAREAPD